MRLAVDKRYGACGQPGRSQRRLDGKRHDRPRGGECVGADAEDDGIAAAEHAAGVRQDVRAAFEDEGDDAEGRADHLDAEAVVLNRLEHGTAARGHRRPAAQPLDHFLAHGVRDPQAGRRAATTSGARDILRIDGRDPFPHGVVLERTRSLAVEGNDRIVRNRMHRLECARGPVNRFAGPRQFLLRNMQKSRNVVGHDPVARAIACRQGVIDDECAAMRRQHRGTGRQLQHATGLQLNRTMSAV